jgi:GTPase
MMADKSNEASVDEWDDWDESIPSVVELDAFESALDEAIQGLDTIQEDLSYQHAQDALSALVKQVDLTDQERTGLETEIQQLQSMLEKLEQQVVHIAVFGMVSRGKSSLLNALLGQSIFTTGPVHGVTRTRQQASWNIEIMSNKADPDDVTRVSLSGTGRSRIELIDTPGIDEIEGQAREKMAREVAKQADLILFVVAGDITRVEYEALADLRNASKPILLVFNKVDQYPEADRLEIYQKIRDERVRSLLSPNEIVMAAAAPLVAAPKQRPDGTWSAELVTGPPQIDDLKLKILEILDREGKALLALNTLLYADDINEQILDRKLAIRDRAANRIIWQSVTVKSLAIALNPITLLDIISSATLDVALILTLSKLYGLPMTRRDAVGLLRNIAIAMGGISVSELLTTLGLSSLKGALGLAAPVTGGASLLPYASVAIAQAAVAGVSSYGIGQVTKQYLANGASWGPNSPKVVVREILATMDQSYILDRIKIELQSKIKSAPLHHSKRHKVI